jgi:thiamine biosynthesis protein ThiI
MPVIRPIIGLDKVEIEQISRDIGTYNITAKTVDGCTAVPKSPATRSKLKVIQEIENRLDLITLCQSAYENIKIIETI